MKWLEDKSLRDYCGGALMFLLGVGAIVLGHHVPDGHAEPHGTGLLPGRARRDPRADRRSRSRSPRAFAALRRRSASVLPPEWRGWICICAGVVAFVVLGEYGGLRAGDVRDRVHLGARRPRQHADEAPSCSALAIVRRRGGRLLVGAAAAVAAVRSGAERMIEQSLHRPVVRLRRRAAAAQPDVVVLRRAGGQPDRRAARHGRAVGDLDAAAAHLHDARRCRRS